MARHLKGFRAARGFLGAPKSDDLRVEAEAAVPDRADGVVDLVYYLQYPFHGGDCRATDGSPPCVQSHTCYAVPGCVRF